MEFMYSTVVSLVRSVIYKYDIDDYTTNNSKIYEFVVCLYLWHNQLVTFETILVSKSYEDLCDNTRFFSIVRHSDPLLYLIHMYNMIKKRYSNITVEEWNDEPYLFKCMVNNYKDNQLKNVMRLIDSYCILYGSYIG